MALMVVAVACGLAASYMTSKLLAERKGPPQEEKVPVLVAKTKVPRNTQLKEPEKFFEVKWRLKSDAPQSYFSSLDEIKDRKVNKEFKADVHISPEDVVDKGVAGLPIPDGFGAIGLKINAVSAAGFFVQPGDRIDLVLTQKGDNPTSSTILREVLVLSVGAQVAPVQESGQNPTIQAQTITVAVKGDEANLIRLAESQGELSFLLRKDGDKTDIGSGRVITRNDLSRAARSGSLALGLPKPEDQDPNKLPFGWGLDELKKPEKSDRPKGEDEPADEEKEPEQLPPDVAITIEPGAGPAIVVPFWKKHDGSYTRTPLTAPKEPKKDEKKPEAKKPEAKKPQPKPN
jgi:pilus assembly protein CpaB